jgi:hypothetical protein
MDFKVYEQMCKLFLGEEGEEFIFARCFLTLEWNLMARSENVVHAHMFHVTWDNDSLVFRFVKSKGDFHDEVLRRMERVGHSGYAALGQLESSAGANDAIQVSRGDNDEVSAVNNTLITMVERDERRFQIFYSAGGAVKRVPDGFVFPKMTLATLLTSWFSGNQSTRTIPYKLLKAAELETKREKHQLCKMRILIDAVIVGAKQEGVWREQRGAWDIGSTVRLFESVKHLFEYPTKSGQIRRTVQISWLTVYNLYVKMGRKFATELTTTTMMTERRR